MNPFMLRALELATLGRGSVSPNPMVGCVIVHHPEGREPRIIGEGWHKQYGDWHAEVNAIRSVRPQDTHLLPEATVYVTLEPCSHWGKTPPCADLLIENRVKHVICCNDDPNPLVSGQGFAKLRAAGISVETGVLAKEGRELNARFFTFIEQRRPYIILKWAETTDGYLSGEGGQPIQISGPLARRLVHKWRSEEDAIMVGTNTARMDNPRLNVRLWPIDRDPVRIVFDRDLSLPPNLHLFDGSQPTIVFHRQQKAALPERPNLTYVFTDSLAQSLTELHQSKIQSVLVEGGTTVLQAFMDTGLWDEMRVLRSPMMLGKSRTAVVAPRVEGRLMSREMVGEDELSMYRY
ncbi:bifunctional diaminohydroxyphosphoribosylaminopyrimidine deaminase/5-amino-6-(5-phosphoribosylamino)uracil reductase RibD [Spirosoma spitsbergense]|uniref:bifunctional diaminohydroxyphosphoribosylaminopyrimidine deaminase/5-amino-6-(5-phosphoribosylamino)uracil reductase RibD n=1 Tax=Spirosoma spitsbergense TaxID=431554 RepID=UPI0003670A15|nr:bifunctional diaminohydroxyphosphoribosylaminopyrimidine deaminase/5-amino-6-(5-phosphoribosylamino)uracil reductase RibD [Spirosoma spitsbergense]